jgi:hypothetical protein
LFGNSGGSPGRRESPVEAMVKSAARSIGSQVGRQSLDLEGHRYDKISDSL